MLKNGVEIVKDPVNRMTTETEHSFTGATKQLQVRHASALLDMETYRDKVQWRTAN